MKETIGGIKILSRDKSSQNENRINSSDKKKNKTLFAAGLSATSARSRDQKTQFLKSQLLYR